MDRQVQEQGIQAKYCPGVIDLNMPFKGVHQAHRNIIFNAKHRGLPMVAIAEDDIVFTAPGAYDYFIQNIPEDFDLYLGGITQGHIDPNGQTRIFTGMFLYICHERFYDTVLNLNIQTHIDAEISTRTKGVFKVCDPFVCTHADGYSEQKRTNVSYSHYFNGRNLFGK